MTHPIQKDIQKDWEKRICTCRKKWLDDNSHYLNCPVFEIQKLLSSQKQELVEELEQLREWPEP